MLPQYVCSAMSGTNGRRFTVMNSGLGDRKGHRRPSSLNSIAQACRHIDSNRNNTTRYSSKHKQIVCVFIGKERSGENIFKYWRMFISIHFAMLVKTGNTKMLHLTQDILFTVTWRRTYGKGPLR